jgi:hypothetical protein
MAQAIHFLPPPQVKLPAQPGAAFVARVVDARPQRTSVGRVYLRKSLLPVPATFRSGLVPTLQAFFAQYAPGQAGAIPLVMRITALEIADTPEAMASIITDFYAPQPDSSYRLVVHFAQMFTKPIGNLANVTAKLDDNLGDLLLTAALASRTQAAWQSKGPTYPSAYVLAPESHPAEILPILDAHVQFKPGFYHSLPEFWYNQPSEPGQPEVESRPYISAEWAGDSEVTPYRRTADGQRVPATNIWGFSDGRDFYLQQGRNFYRLVRRGQGFVFHGRIRDDPTYQTNTNSYIMGQSAIVGLMASAAAPSPERRALFSLSPLTGGTSLDPSATNAPLATRPTQLFVYRPRSAKGPAVRIRLGEEQTAQELAVGQFLSFSPSSDQPLRVYFLPGAGPETSLTITPTAEAPTYLE